MQNEHILFHLKEVREELDSLEIKLSGEALVSDDDLAASLQHMYHHLNYLWSKRELTLEQCADESQLQFNLSGAFPGRFVKLLGVYGDAFEE